VNKSAKIIVTRAERGPGLKPDTSIAALVEKAEAKTRPLTRRVVGEAKSGISRAPNPAGESVLGNFIADAQRAAMGTDFAFTNPEGIRAGIEAGKVTWGDLYTVQPFNNYLVKMELTGQQVMDLLNQQWAGQPYPRMLQISGLTYTWNSKSPVGNRSWKFLKTALPLFCLPTIR